MITLSILLNLLTVVDSGWTFFNKTGLYYRYFESRQSWAEARCSCQLQGQDGELASVPDNTTNTFILNLAPRYTWLGGKWNWRWGTMELEWRQCLGIWKLEKWRTKQCWRPPRLFRHLGREMEWLALGWTLGFTNSYTWFPLSKERSVVYQYLPQIIRTLIIIVFLNPLLDTNEWIMLWSSWQWADADA